MNSKKARKHIQRRYFYEVVLCILLAFLLSVYAVFARYRTAIRGVSSAKVAAAVMTLSSTSVDSEKLNFSEDGSVEIGTLTVKNSNATKINETSIKYTVSIVSATSMTDNMRPVLVNGNTTYTPASISADRKTFVFQSDDFELSNGIAMETTYSVKIMWAASSVPASDISYSITAAVTAEQQD